MNSVFAQYEELSSPQFAVINLSLRLRLMTANFGLNNSSYRAQPHSIIVKYSPFAILSADSCVSFTVTKMLLKKPMIVATRAAQQPGLLVRKHSAGWGGGGGLHWNEGLSKQHDKTHDINRNDILLNAAKFNTLKLKRLV